MATITQTLERLSLNPTESNVIVFHLHAPSEMQSKLGRIKTIIDTFKDNAAYQDPLSTMIFCWKREIAVSRFDKDCQIESALNALQFCFFDSVSDTPLRHPLLVKETRWTCEAALIQKAALRVTLTPHELAQQLLDELTPPQSESAYQDWQYNAYTTQAHQSYMKFRLHRFIENAPNESAELNRLVDALRRESNARMQRVRQELAGEIALLQDKINLIEAQSARDAEKARSERDELRKELRRLETESLQIKIAMEIQNQKLRELEMTNYLNTQHLRRLQEQLDDQGSSCTIL